LLALALEPRCHETELLRVWIRERLQDHGKTEKIAVFAPMPRAR
jgi:hypothetical protein